MSRKKKKQVEGVLFTKSYAQLDKEIAKILEDNKEDRPIEELFAHDGKEFNGDSPPHMILGRPYEDTKKSG